MAKPQMYSMKWNNYRNHINEIFVQLLESQTMVDLTLCAEGEKISCHRIIISACSPYFKEILTNIKSSHAVVILCGISAADIRTIIDFVYKGELNVCAERFVSIIKAAEALKITGLMEVSSHLPMLQVVNPEVEKESDRQIAEVKNEPQLYGDEEATVLGTNLEIVSSNVEYNVEPTNIENVLEYSHIVHDDSAACFTIISDGNEYQSDLCIESDNSIPEIKKKRRREYSKKDYSENAVAAAINDLVQGHSLLETATTHRIPRSTLYARARSYGVSPRITRHEYSEEKLTAAVQTVRAGSSLQTASVMFNIPKTVLWRRVQKDIGSYALSLRARQRQRYLPNAKEAAIRALENGEKINKVSLQYKIPKTTLFREKSRLVEAGKLPRSSLTRRVSNNDSHKQIRLTQAVAACKEGRMSQSAASSAFKVSKTTIWRRLQQCGVNKPVRFFKPKEELEEDNALNFKEVVSDISESYCEEQDYPEASFIILAPNGCGSDLEFKSSQIVMDNVLMAENVEEVGEVIEIQETPSNSEDVLTPEDVS